MNAKLPLRRFRTPLLRAALAICCLIPSGQPALAVVGYVNVTLTNGYNFVANPLDVSPNNSITNLIPSPPNETRVWLWNITNQSFDAPSTFINPSTGWTLNLFLPPGRGFVVHTLANYTNTFVGTVLQGSLTNFVAGTNRLTLLASKVPVGGSLATAILFPGSDGDVVSIYPTLSQQYQNGHTYLSGHGWFDPEGVVDTNGPVIPVASAFFVRHRGPDTNWIRFFVVNLGTSLVSGGSGGSPPPDILGLTIQNGVATLHLSETSLPYNVQFSTDRTSWTTISTNQTGSTWTGACPAVAAGFFQLVSP